MTDSPNYQWYALHVPAGSEQKFVRDVMEKLTRYQVEQDLKEVFIPFNEGQQQRNGRKKITKATHMPGYIFLELNYSPETAHLILSCHTKGPKFLNCDALGKPRALCPIEFERLKKSIDALNAQNVEKITFEVGESVKITEGTFATLEGTVESFDNESQRLKVSISIFGQRHVFLDLDFSCVEKLS